MKKIVLLGLVFAYSLASSAQIVSTIAGNGVAGFSGDSSAAIAAELNGPDAVALDASGNIYISDQYNQRVRKIATDGTIITIAGNGIAGYAGDSDLAASAELNNPVGIAIDASGNVYIADMSNNRIRKIDAAGIITTIAGTGAMGFSGDNGPAISAKLNLPTGIAFGKNGNLYIADKSNQRVRMIDGSGVITTVAGTGVGGYNGDDWPSAINAELYAPANITFDRIGNLFIADQNNNRIRKIDTFGKISTIFGTADAGYTISGVLAVDSRLNRPDGVAVDSFGNVYVSDEGNFRIRKINVYYGDVYEVAGTGVSGYNGDTGIATNTKIGDPKGLAVDKAGNIYFGDWSNNRVNYITSAEFVSPVNEAGSRLNIYPNPNNGSFTVDLTLNNNDAAQLVITNVLGEKVKEMTIKPNTPVAIDLGTATGLYFITATNANGKWPGTVEIAK